MAHVLQACLLLCSRDPRRVGSARPLLARAAGLPANARERCTWRRSPAVLADDYEGAKARVGELLHTIRAMRSRCRWRMRSTTSPATAHA